MSQCAPRINREGEGVDEAHGDEDGWGQDEGDGAALGVLGCGLVQDRDRHHQAALFAIEPATGLDLVHLFARRHFNSKGGFDRLDFGWCRLQEVDPDGVAGHCLGSVVGCILEAARQYLGRG